MIVAHQSAMGATGGRAMLGRKSKSAVVERDLSSAGSRAAEVVGEAASVFAERAVSAAQNAQRVATPVLRTAGEKSAETLSHAAERAAVVLADVGERLADSGVEERAGNAAVAARQRLADASEALAQAVRPKKRRRFRRVLVVVLAGGGIVALVKSLLRSKLTDRLFGAPPDFDDEAPESITLPSSTTHGQAPSAPSATSTESEPSEAAATDGGDSNGVASGSAQTKSEGAAS
jgi:hypothetical protein